MVEAKTKGRTPEAPPLFQFVTSNSSQATLYLTQWESGGCEISHFTVQYKRSEDKVYATGEVLLLLMQNSLPILAERPIKTEPV